MPDARCPRPVSSPSSCVSNLGGIPQILLFKYLKLDLHFSALASFVEVANCRSGGDDVNGQGNGNGSGLGNGNGNGNGIPRSSC